MRKSLLFVTSSAVIGILLAGLLLFGASRLFPDLALFTAETESRDTQIINSVTREEQVVLLSLGIQGISEKTARGELLGVDVPGSGRATFIQYEFQAKLGLDGGEVRITPTGEDEYLVSIPEFRFIGHDDETFRTIVEDNGALSFVTPEIDTTEMINAVLNDEAQDEYVAANREILEDQAKVFYSAIVESIDPTIALTFEYRD